LLAGLCLAARSGFADPVPVTPVPPAVASQVALREVAHGLAKPVLVTFAPNDARRRLFVIEQDGAIRVIEGGKLAKRPFFTIKGLSHDTEEGLLGLAFHPRFSENGRLFIDYTSRDMATHIVEYRVSAKDPDVVDLKTARELLRIPKEFPNHNGGDLVFGPDGKLYTGTGDGGAANDPHGNGQNGKALLGKLLRFDVDVPKPTPEIVHIGLRNPWRFWFDAVSHDLWIGDVGQNLWEEIDVVAGSDHATKNFGWNVMEGTHCFDAKTGKTKEECERAGLTMPIVEYPHEQGCSITGGVTYRGKALPALAGRYFYADFCTGLFRSVSWVDGHVRDHWDWKAAIDRKAQLLQVSSFGTDADGEVYILTLTGSIFELVPAG
jgi:glucose/arabinose dehydrogenase